MLPPLSADRLLPLTNTPGVALVRVIGERTEVSVAGVGTFGGRPLRPTDRFSIGSISKSFTALLCARLVDKGKLRWTTTLGEAWPGEVTDPRLARVTLLDLLRHRSGIGAKWATYPPTVKESWVTGDAATGREKWRRATLKAPFVEKDLKEATYANANFILAALLAERAGGADWPTLVTREVFRPLGITNEMRAGLARADDGTTGHSKRKEGWRTEPGAGNGFLLWGADGVYASPLGIATYLRAHFTESPRFLRPATWAIVHAEEGLGLYAQGERFPEPTWRWHNGSNTLNYGAIAFDPVTKRGGAVLANGASPQTEQMVEVALGAMFRQVSNSKTIRRS